MHNHKITSYHGDGGNNPKVSLKFYIAINYDSINLTNFQCIDCLSAPNPSFIVSSMVMKETISISPLPYEAMSSFDSTKHYRDSRAGRGFSCWFQCSPFTMFFSV